MIVRASARAASAIFLTAFFAHGQPAPPVQFDVVSIKAYKLQDGNFMLRPLPGGIFRAAGVTLKMLIMFAYNIKAFQVSGLPGWAGIDLWEIEAKTDGWRVPPRAQTHRQEYKLYLRRDIN